MSRKDIQEGIVALGAVALFLGLPALISVAYLNGWWPSW